MEWIDVLALLSTCKMAGDARYSLIYQKTKKWFHQRNKYTIEDMKEFFVWAFTEKQTKIIDTKYFNLLSLYVDGLTLIKNDTRYTYNLKTEEIKEEPAVLEVEKKLFSLGIAPVFTSGSIEYYMAGSNIYQVAHREKNACIGALRTFELVHHNPYTLGIC